VSFACVVSCWGVEAAIPPCHHHASSCAPLLLTSEAPGVIAAAAPPPALAMPVPVAPAAPNPDAEVSTALDPVPLFSPPAQTPAVLRI
jgi:hypothetical protein